MTVTHGFHATMTAQAGRGDEVVKLLLDAPSLPDENCVVFLVGRSAGNPDVVHVTEGWTSQQAHSAFFGSARARAFVAALQELLTGESEYTDEVPLGGKAAF
ncbi:putative quinol monooxygenase [Paractinoplanes maris]|uniref:putative quinol monooxygenase n=1 Tax=Paractinoplanes maris TaxID=1734446 RepID=UPI0020207184|nr:antibiotic biosynthesis monooxygenase [Actinoplanes maris]